MRIFHVLVVALLLARGSGVVAAAEARPFPQRIVYAKGSILPTAMLIDGRTVAPTRGQLEAPVRAFAAAWRARYLRTIGGGPFSRTSEAYVSINLDRENADIPRFATVSEAHGYGMLITVLMAGAEANAHQEFDSLVRYFQNPAHKSRVNHELLAFRQVGRDLHTTARDADSAADGDLDIAYALLLAQAQWGDGGAIDYGQEAHALLAAILASEVEPALDIIQLGDWVKDGGGAQYAGGTRSSDFLVQHWHAFAQSAPEQAPRWESLRRHAYEILAQAFAKNAASTGLMPDFFACHLARHPGIFEPVKGKYLESAADGSFYYNACRTPWRLATDHLLTGDPRAVAQLTQLNRWIQRATARPGHPADPARINAGYTLAGQPLYPRREDSGSCFTAPLAVSAMISAENQPWLNALWQQLVESVRPGAEAEGYYSDTVKLLCLIVLTGNWWEPAAPLERNDALRLFQMQR